MAKELHADAIIEGSVQRSGDHVRITAQLVRADTDKHLWADAYERDFHDILAMQDDVASAIAKQVQFRLGGPEPIPVAKSKPISPEAYETYLKANSYADQFDLQKSIDFYNQAIKLAPDYAPAYAHMAGSYFFQGFFGAMAPQKAWGKVKELAQLATAKDDQLPDGHNALAAAKLHYDWDFAGAEREFKRAIELNPSNADTLHGYAHYLMAMGRMDESAAESLRAVALDPVDDGLTDCLCWHSYAAHQYDSSIQLALEVLKRQPDDSWEMVIVGWDYEQKKMNAEAIAQFKKAVDAPQRQHYVRIPPRRVGPRLRVGGEQERRASGSADSSCAVEGVLRFALRHCSGLYRPLGDKETAFAWLDKAVAERSTWLVYSKWEPRLDPLRNDPRFVGLLRRIGLAQ